MYSIILPVHLMIFTKVEREGRLTAQQKSKKGGWFGGWFSSRKTQSDETAESEDDIGKTIK